MNSKRYLLRNAMIALASVSAVAGTGAHAADEARQPSTLFLHLDTNHDGYVSRTEAANARGIDRAFADADDNGDGRLSVDEFLKAESIQQRRQMAEYATDSVITAKVKAVLLKELEMKAFDVSVETRRGRVLLSGLVDDPRQARRAAQIASTVHGVERVENALKQK